MKLFNQGVRSNFLVFYYVDAGIFLISLSSECVDLDSYLWALILGHGEEGYP